MMSQLLRNSMRSHDVHQHDIFVEGVKYHTERETL